jgi:hypothetical protein
MRAHVYIWMIPFEHSLLVFNQHMNQWMIIAFYEQFQLPVHWLKIIIRFFSLSIKGSSVNRTNSSASPHGHNKNTGSTDGDEFCRITIDSLTNSYKIGSPVKPRSQNGRQIRSTSHSLLTAPYMEGK